MEHNSQSIELMDALRTIGRNIAQQDTVQMRLVHALETTARCLQSLLLLAAIFLVATLW